MAYDERYALAQAVARQAGALALEYWRNRERLTVELKGPQDFVSRADREVEALIRRALGAAFPDDRSARKLQRSSPAQSIAAGWSIRSTARTTS